MLRLAALIGLLASGAAAQTEKCADDSAAYKAATDHVMFQLKSPFSAVFPELGTEYTNVENIGGCEFAVTGFVDALNSHGRSVRQGFSLNVEYDSRNAGWTATGLSVTGSSPSP
jgi:hypothetical protein